MTIRREQEADMKKSGIKNVDEKIEGYKKQLRILSDALKAQPENTETEEE